MSGPQANMPKATKNTVIYTIGVSECDNGFIVEANRESDHKSWPPLKRIAIAADEEKANKERERMWLWLTTA